MTERRNAPRQKTYKVGRIAFGGNRAVMGCIVRNLSDTGACLGVESPVDLPDAFNLVFDSGKASRTCYVMWRTDRRMGVAFLSGDLFPTTCGRLYAFNLGTSLMAFSLPIALRSAGESPSCSRAFIWSSAK
jgi:hypothetical protein